MAKAGKELYVGSLSYDITEYEVQKLFSVSGRVTSIHLITDPVTGDFKGCGYVRMSTEAEAKDAINSLDGAWLLDKQITVSYANPQKMKPGGGGAKFVPKRRGAGTGEKAAGAKAAAAKPAAPKAAKPGGAKPAGTKSGGAKAAGTRSAAAKTSPSAKQAGRPAAKPAATKAPSAKPAASRPAAPKAGSRSGKR